MSSITEKYGLLLALWGAVAQLFASFAILVLGDLRTKREIVAIEGGSPDCVVWQLKMQFSEK